MKVRQMTNTGLSSADGAYRSVSFILRPIPDRKPNLWWWSK